MVQNDSRTTNTLVFPMLSLDWNPIEANLLGAQSVFSGDTPFSEVMASWLTFNTAFQDKKPQGRPDIIEVIPGEDGRPAPDDGLVLDPATGRAIPRTPGINPAASDGGFLGGVLGGIGATIGGVRGIGESVDKAVENKYGSYIDDGLKRIALVVLAILIIFAAVVSLR